MRYFIRTNPDLAYEMVYELGAFLQGCIPAAMGMEKIPLMDELRHAGAYAKLVFAMKNGVYEEEDFEKTEVMVKPGSVYEIVRELLSEKEVSDEEACRLHISQRRENADTRIRIRLTGDKVDEERFLTLS